MAIKGNTGENNTRSYVSIVIVVGLCCFFYLLGAWQRSGFGKGDSIALHVNSLTDCTLLPNLNFETHHNRDSIPDDLFGSNMRTFKPCDDHYNDYTPCQHQTRAMTFPRENMIYNIKLVASLGAYLLKKNVLTMSFAPRDSHEAQVQFALERGVPAVIGVFGSILLPYPSRAFDMAHCSRCLIPWGSNEGMYMMEVDRVLRPGGFWVLSGPPINWKQNFENWARPKEDLEEEQRKIEEIAELLCWEKFSEKGEIAVWRKRINADSCPGRQDEPRVKICESANTGDVWYKKLESCVTPYPEVNSADEVAGGAIKTFPERLSDVPPRISSGSVPGISVESYHEDNSLWKQHIKAYKSVNKLLDTGRYRNIMDMNAGLGSFAAALESPKLWVMNVVPTIAEKSTLGVIYERGLIGIYHDWCEAFSTYPRTYDLIHANGVFSLYKNKCKMEDILLEMDRILRPEGAVIFRDQVDVLVKVKKLAGGMRWNTKMADHEDGSHISEKILYVVKQYWVGGGNKNADE